MIQFFHTCHLAISITTQLHVLSYGMGPRSQVINVPDVSSVVSRVGTSTVDHHREEFIVHGPWGVGLARCSLRGVGLTVGGHV